MGFGKEVEAVTYKFDYQRHPQTIEKVEYVETVTKVNNPLGYIGEKDVKTVSCFITLTNGAKIEGRYFQTHDYDLELFKGYAYQEAIDTAEQLGYKIVAVK